MKVIHVDTNIYALDAMREDLSQIVPEAELHSFERPNDAMRFAEAHGCDVLLTEIELWTEPLGGIRLAEVMRKRSPRVNIIFVTVCDENEVAHELSGLFVSGFLPKPWSMEKLTATFQNLRCPVQPHTTM